MTDSTILPNASEPRIGRRTIIKAAAWTIPVMTLAVAAPAAAASTDSDLGAYTLTGTCGLQGIQGPGFLLKAAPSIPLPAGTTFLITGSGVSNVGVFSTTGGTATVTVINATTRLVTLTADLSAGATLAARTTLSTSVAFTLNATVTLPSGYVSASGKPSAAVNSTLVMCTGS